MHYNLQVDDAAGDTELFGKSQGGTAAQSGAHTSTVMLRVKQRYKCLSKISLMHVCQERNGVAGDDFQFL